jgi:Zn-dependent protease
VVAIAGPLVNVAIAGILAAILLATGGIDFQRLWPPMSGSFVSNVMTVNVLLVLFNLLPAFPMDGGRMLRSLLATRMEYSRATAIAAGIGQFMAIMFAVYGLFVAQPAIRSCCSSPSSCTWVRKQKPAWRRFACCCAMSRCATP